MQQPRFTVISFTNFHISAKPASSPYQTPHSTGHYKQPNRQYYILEHRARSSTSAGSVTLWLQQTNLNDDTTLWISKKPGTFRNTSFRNLNTSHPLYSTLGHRPRVSKYRDHYHHLQAHALIAYRCFMKETNRIKAHNKLLHDGLAAVRSLTHKEYQAELNELPETPCTPEHYLREITSNQIPKGSRIRVFAQFLEQAIAFNRNAHRTVGRKAKPKIPDEDNRITTTYRSYSFRDHKPDDAQDYLKQPLRTTHRRFSRELSPNI